MSQAGYGPALTKWKSDFWTHTTRHVGKAG